MQQHTEPSTARQLTPALAGATHEFVGLCIPQVRLEVGYLLVECPFGNRPALPPFEVQVLLLQGLVLCQLLLLFLQLHAMFENHLGRLVERRSREKALTAHVPNCPVLQSTYFLLQQEKTGMPPDPSMTDNVNCKTVLCMLMDITLMVLSPVSANYKLSGDLVALVGRADLR